MPIYKVYHYRGYTIEPKRDFNEHGNLVNGKYVYRGWGPYVYRGWVVTKDGCNIMPGATWFRTLKMARHGIDTLIKTGDTSTFWEIMQPFEYTKIGQLAGFENGTVEQGRFSAIIKDWRVVKLITKSTKAYAKSH